MQKSNELIDEHIDYAKTLAKQFYHERRYTGVELDDLEGAALLGLCDAASRFDSSRGYCFKSFGYLRIRGSMIDLLRAGAGVPRRHFHQVIKNYKTEEEESEVTHRFAKNVIGFASLVNSADNINVSVHISEKNEFAGITYACENSPESNVADKDYHSYIRRLIRRLPLEQEKAVRLKYFHNSTLSGMRKEFGGVSRSWISRIHQKALDNLKNYIRDDSSICLGRMRSYVHQ